MNTIKIGNMTFTDDALTSGSCYIAESITAAELQIDTLDVTIEDETLLYEGLYTSMGEPLYSKNGLQIMVRKETNDLLAYTYGEPVAFYHDDLLIGRFYLLSVMQVAPEAFALSCVSAIGLLDNTNHYGGIYDGQLAGDIIAEIIGGIVPYQIDDDVASTTVYGWLPIATRRDNLHQVLFALGANVKKDTAGTIQIVFLKRSKAQKISDDRIYLGGSVDFGTAATLVQITEHSYVSLSTDERVDLFDNSDGSTTTDTKTVTFEEPCHDLMTTGSLKILENGVNYAIVSGFGVLSGQKYTHQTTIIEQGDSFAAQDNVKSVTDATLVSLANSTNVADRIYNYYSSATTVSSDLVVGAERPGDLVRFQTPFKEAGRGYIKDMEITMSNLLKAGANIITNFQPTRSGNFFTKSVVLPMAGTYNLSDLGISEEQTQIRVVLIGGGNGGESGTAGTEGGKGSGSSTGGFGSNGDPGDGGAAGDGGKITSYTIDLTSLDSLAIAIGTGGSAGQAGSNTTVSALLDGTQTAYYSSADGATAEKGYHNTLTGLNYAQKGTDGVAGGEASELNGFDDTGKGITVQNTVLYKGVLYRSGLIGSYAKDSGLLGSPGNGGGAAAGVNGGNGGDGDVDPKNTDTDKNGNKVTVGFADGGSGGTGATPVRGSDAPSTDYGRGGDGGNGGGAGAGGGNAYNSHGSSYYWAGSGGSGGSGSAGGKGANGCVILFF